MPSRIAVLIALAGLPAAVEAQDCVWTSTIGPFPITGSLASAYDSARHRLVVFSGASGNIGDLGQTWEWDGLTWMQAAATGPSARFRPKAVFDSVRNKTVLFGGLQRNGVQPSIPLGDTWEWDGVSWSLRADTLNLRGDPRMLVFDPVVARTVLMTQNSLDTETYHWDGALWTFVALGGPNPYTIGGAAFNPASGRVLIAASQTWEWNGTAWTQVGSNGYSGPIFWDNGRGRMIGIHPAVNGPTATREWNGTSWTLRSAFGPVNYEPVGFDESTSRLIGYTGGRTWMWNGSGTREFLAFTQTPTPLQVAPGGTAVFTGIASNPGPITYQWSREGVPLSDDGRISGSHTAQLTISTIQESDYGAYALLASDVCRSQSSNTGLSRPSTGDCYPNCDHSTSFPFVNANDFNCFLNLFASGFPYANCDQSTNPPILNANDFLCYLNKYAAGCSAP